MTARVHHENEGVYLFSIVHSVEIPQEMFHASGRRSSSDQRRRLPERVHSLLQRQLARRPVRIQHRIVSLRRDRL